ncbi:hypothetical protein R3P38DRAFT_2802787 [Favolaschia claudopus]|uniref:J domain-containing protein n=1 Tax=Favolaschia claudopus TaxID=2862362 RepID=A0AAV9ZV66_9AGAR
MTLSGFLAGYPIDPTAPISTLLNPRIIERKRDLSFGPPIRTVLADTACRPFANDFVCDEAAEFYIVTDEESVIFFDKDEAGVVFAELIVVRDVFGEQAICEWFQDVIDTAVNERRDVRPKSDGTMVQLGYNAGPRDLRVFQLAKSYTKNLDEQTKADHDTERGCRSITNKIEDTLEENGLPRIATRNIPAGNGYQIQFRDLAYNFPTFERGLLYLWLLRTHATCLVSAVSALMLAVPSTLRLPRLWQRQAYAKHDRRPARAAHLVRRRTWAQISNASTGNMRKCWLKVSMIYHPDKNADMPQDWQDLCDAITKRLNSKFS